MWAKCRVTYIKGGGECSYHCALKGTVCNYKDVTKIINYYFFYYAVLHDVHEIKAHRINHMIELKNCWTDLGEIRYEYRAIGADRKILLFNFLNRLY
jgi:hypothetical protein